MVLLVNDFFLKRGLVNGSRGVVTAFSPANNNKLGPSVYPVVRFDNDEEMTIRPRMFKFTINSREERTSLQLPLNLAWAITVHKSQGMSISRLEVDISNCFEAGQAYTALSRAKDMNNLWIRGRLPRKFKTSEKVKRFYSNTTV